jgi:hypothetical protein
MFSELLQFRSGHGDCRVPEKWRENPTLSTWVHTQRQARKKNWLSEERIRRLTEIGFIWDRRGDAWEQMFTELLDYSKTYGDCNVPAKWPENTCLGRWVSTQRDRKRIGRLSQARMRRLDEIGFAWVVVDWFWERMFARLVEYRKVHGNSSVPAEWAEDPNLGSWVATQRQQRKNGRLEQGLLKRLEELQFVWEPSDTKWEKMFSELLQYKETHGNCNVSPKWQVNPKLGNWVGTQRNQKKKGLLTNDRIQRLNEVGFFWGTRAPRRPPWDEMFNALLEYREIHHNPNVPAKWHANRQLGAWVDSQRSRYKNGKLSEDRIRRLNGIGFQWELAKRRGK